MGQNKKGIEKRNEIVKTTAELITRFSTSSLTTYYIASYMNIPKSTVSYHFDNSKLCLFTAAIEYLHFTKSPFFEKVYNREMACENSIIHDLGYLFKEDKITK